MELRSIFAVSAADRRSSKNENHRVTFADEDLPSKNPV